MVSEVADWCPPDLPPHGDRGGGQPCGAAPSPTCGSVGGVQGWSTENRGGNPNCPADFGSRLRLRGNMGATLGVRHGLRRLVETTSSLAPNWMVKYRAAWLRMVQGPSYSVAKGGMWPSQQTSTWEASSRAAGSSVGWTCATAVLCRVERFSDLLKVALIVDMKLSREVSGSVAIWPGKTREEPKTAWAGVMSVSSRGVARMPSMTQGRC